MKMDPYYSSDEEIAWGPLTLNEIKKELSYKPKNVGTRKSDLSQYSCFYTPSASMTEEKNHDVNTTGTSAYFTPNESLQPDLVLNKNEVFLEKLNSIIESESSDSTEPVTNFTAADGKRDTLFKILDSNKYDNDCHLDDIQQTLVDNTVRISHSKENSVDNLVIDLVIDEESDVDSSQVDDDDEVIEISDDSLLIPNQQDSEIFSVGVKVEGVSPLKDVDIHNVNDKVEVQEEVRNVSSTDSEDYPFSDLSNSNNEIVINESMSDQQCNNENDDRETSRISQTVQNLSRDDFDRHKYSNNTNPQNPTPSCVSTEDTYDSDNTNPQNHAPSCASSEDAYDSDNTNPQNLASSCARSEDAYDSDNNNPQNHAPSCASTEDTYDSDNTNPQNLAPSCTSNEDAFESDSFKFNDTMEEMEMALRQGLDYVMPDDDDNDNNDIAKTPVLTNTTNIPPPPETKKRFLKTPNKYDYIQSPIGDYIRKQSPIQNNFKIPQKVVKKKAQTPTPKTVSNSYKGIVSPIGVYLKNSPQVRLKQNVVAKTVPYLESPRNQVKSNKENNFKSNNLCQLPTVLYKPGKKITTFEEQGPNLPANIKNMITETNLMKHEMKIVRGQRKDDLLEFDEGDLTTVDNSLLNQTGENISFVQTKKAYIK